MSDFILRKWKPSDEKDVANYGNNKKIADNLRDAFPHPYSLKDAQEFINACLSADERQKMFRAIEIDGKAAGSIGVFKGGDIYRKSGELGYWLAEPYWGSGIMSAAAQRICAEAFEKLDIVRIFAEPFAYNAASRKVLEKAGFVLEGVMKNAAIKNGEIFDYCMYALLKV